MDKTLALYLEFLRFCLNDGRRVPECIKQINWHNLLEFAQKQCITGMFIPTLLMEDGRLSIEHFGGNKPTDEDVMEWMFEKQKLERLNNKAFLYTAKVSQKFEKLGFRNCILKGQGNAINYKYPLLRGAGDIDIWVEGGEEKVLALVEKYYQPKEVTKIHVDFPIISKFPVEVHFRPSYLLNPFLDKKLVKWFDHVADEQFSNLVKREGVTEPFYAPTNYFNLFYQLLHIHRHLIKRGIGLRQIIDYFYLLKKRKEDGVDPEADKNLLSLLKQFKLEKFARAILYIESALLGIDADYLYLEPDEKEGLFIINEVLEGGNFGYHDSRIKKELESAKGHFKRFLVLESFNLRLLKHYPSETMWMPVQDLIDHFSRRKKNVE
jgi:hypothetical protein